MNCPNCNREIRLNDKFCPSCGKQMPYIINDKIEINTQSSGCLVTSIKIIVFFVIACISVVLFFMLLPWMFLVGIFAIGAIIYFFSGF